MTNKEIKLGPEARKKLVTGIETLASAVVATLGPNGRNVIYWKDGKVHSTKDGVTVAKEITNLADLVENLGLNMVKEAAIKTGDKAGDGTTTSTLLASELVKLGIQRLNDGANAVEVKRGIDEAVQLVLKELKKNSEEVQEEGQLEQIATISGNNDSQVGKLISRAIEKVGKEGIVHIEESKTGDTYLEVVEGLQFDRGFKSPYFVNSPNNDTAILKDTLVLIADQKFTQVKDLLPILNQVSQLDKSLLIIAEDIDNEALAALIVNKMKGILKVCAVKAPDFGDRRKLVLEDIAILTGGTVFDKDKGMKLDRFEMDWLGNAKTVTVTKEDTTIIDGAGEKEDVLKRAEQLTAQIESSDTPFEQEKLQERLAKFAGGVAIIHVGGSTEVEMGELKDRVDDALNATKAALEEGIVPGGGIALMYSRKVLKKARENEMSESTKFGYNLVYDACAQPFRKILQNAGYTESEAIMIGQIDLKDCKKFWDGFNLKTKTVVNMKKEGIIDPFKVTRQGLTNAASVAGTILLTEAAIVDVPEDKDSQPQFDPSMLQGMM